jgi:parallel beta-helix repeat protein
MRKAALVLVALFALAFLFVGCGKSEKDKTAPALSAISTSGVTTTSVVVTWTTDEAATSQVEYGLASSYGSTTTLDTDLVTSHSVNLTGLTAGTTYHYRADSTDAAGNKGVSADFTFSTSSAGPVIALVAVSSVTSTGATITWTTDEAATSQVEYGLTSSYGSTTTLDTNLVTNHSVNLTGLTAGTAYHYRVRSKDAAAQETLSGDTTFTTSAGGGPTYHSGTISSAETWKAADNPHMVTSKVYVESTLTLEPGVVVKFNTGMGLVIGYNNPGALAAAGTQALPITFTSAASTPSPGDWDGISFEGRTIDSTTKLDYCLIEYGGGNTYGNIYCTDASPTVTNCTIKYGSNYGVYSYGAGGFNSFANNTVTQNTKFPLRVEAEYARTIGSGNTLTGNTTDGIEVSSGEITSSGTWLSQSVPYIIAGDLDLSGTAGPVLTIAAGNTLKFRANAGIDVGYNNPGALVAVGTAGSLITFTSAVSPASPGDWDGITFWDGTIDGTTKLDYCVIEYGGGNGYGNIYCNDASPTITNCAINYSSTWGIWQGTTPPTMSGNTFTGNASGDVGGP